jgi:long-subunit acyl-CoA synthetase (AMP-forming)
VNDTKPGDNWLSYLPMAWVGDAAFSLGMALAGKLVANCPESPESVQRDLRELGPNAMLAPPRIWENMLTLMQVKGDDASPTKRAVFEHFRALAERCELKRTDGKPLSLGERLGLMAASSSSTARCATSSACAMRAGATLAARRSGPTPTASSARSASTSSRSTARPRPRR